MTKELEAFKKIAEIYGKTASLEGTYDYFLTIKQALLKAQEDNTILKLALDFVNEVSLQLHLTDIDEMLERIENLEEAWEVVVEKMVSIRLLNACDCVNDYNQETHNLKGLAYGLPELTEEEFDLLKEMIECQNH